MLQRRIEEVALNSWPALQQVLYDGWIIRFSNGYTKRANSINPLYPSSLEYEHKIEFCEVLYAQKRLPPIFRITPLSSAIGLEKVLTQRGYRKVEPTAVMCLDLAGDLIQADSFLENLPPDEWSGAFCQLSEVPQEKSRTHLAIVTTIPYRCLFAAVLNNGKIVACGLGVFEGELCGLFNLVTAPAERNKGFGRRLVAGLLNWGKSLGARYAYLQVSVDNEIARRLYSGYNFQEAYRYWYWSATRDEDGIS
jgi:ribosomal protein S18 acetylase RimI-like enzyme